MYVSLHSTRHLIQCVAMCALSRFRATHPLTRDKAEIGIETAEIAYDEAGNGIQREKSLGHHSEFIIRTSRLGLLYE